MTTATVSFDRILVPTDFSGFSSQALRHALALARKFNSRLKVVHVIQGFYPVGDAMLAAAPQVEARKMAESGAHAFMAPARDAGVDYDLEIREGDPWREILTAAANMPADLVVMGTHGRGGAERFLLGSVAEKLSHRLPCPVMTVCHAEGPAFEAPGLIARILCATDFSENSERACRFSFALAASLGARVTLLHSIDHLPDLGAARYRMVVPDVGPLLKELERTASERLSRAVDSLRREFVDVDVTTRLGEGPAYKEIIRVAADARADLIVIGAQGHGLLEHLLSGSNAQKVIRSANCAVLTVRGQVASLKEHRPGTAPTQSREAAL